MKCLCCGKEISAEATAGEINSSWHLICVKKFFGTSEMPEINISEERFLDIIGNSVNKGITVPGVQKKLSLHLDMQGVRPRLTLINYPSGFILKPQTEQYKALPESEYIVMQMAAQTGISTVPHALIRTGEDNSTLAYISKRIDRVSSSGKASGIECLAMEDFCQLEGRLTENKYQGSYERCSKIISSFSSQPGLDLSELFLRLVFCFVTGNSDMHLKNFSLIETKVRSAKYVLSAAYDLLPVNIIIPEDKEQTALTLNGRNTKIRRKDFAEFANYSGIQKNAADRMIDKVISMKDMYLKMCEDSYLPEDMRENLMMLIRERTDTLCR